MPHHVSRARFDELVEAALAQLPAEFAGFLEEARVEVQPRATPAQRRRVGGTGLLLGLYYGRPLTQRNIEQSGAMPDVIYIFQEDIELASDNERDLIEQVRVTVLHEIGHLFGLDEEALRRLGYG